MAFRFRACSGRISSIPILHCTKSRDRVRLQPSDQRRFGPEIKAPLRRQANRRVEWSNARHDADRPDAGNGIEQEFGAAHSSSQRSSDTIGNTPPPSCQSLLMTPAGPPPPAGVIVFARHLANHTPQSKIARRHQLRAYACAAFSEGYPNACSSCMGAIPIARFCPSSEQAISFSSVGRRSPPPNVPDKDWQPLLLPSCQSISATPAGSPPRRALLFALQPTNLAWLLYLCGAEPGIWPEFRLNFRLTCIKRMGAILHLRCHFSQRSVYSNSSDQGGAKDERPPSTQAHERGK